MKTIKKIILTLLGLNIIIFYFVGCGEPKVVTIVKHIDANGTEIQPKKEMYKFNHKIACDKRGYAYYMVVNDRHTSYTPILENKDTGVFQLTCKDVE